MCVCVCVRAFSAFCLLISDILFNRPNGRRPPYSSMLCKLASADDLMAKRGKNHSAESTSALFVQFSGEFSVPNDDFTKPNCVIFV